MTKIVFSTHLVLGPWFVHSKGIVIQLEGKYKLYAELEKIHKRFFMVLQGHLKNIDFRVFGGFDTDCLITRICQDRSLRGYFLGSLEL